MRPANKLYDKLLSTIFVILIPFITFSQSLVLPNGDTLLTMDENDHLLDISHNYMGKMESNGSILNSQGINTGRIDFMGGIIYNSSEDTVAFFNEDGLYNYDSVLMATVNNQSIYNSENVLVASFSEMVALHALYLMFFYY